MPDYKDLELPGAIDIPWREPKPRPVALFLSYGVPGLPLESPEVALRPVPSFHQNWEPTPPLPSPFHKRTIPLTVRGGWPWQ